MMIEIEIPDKAGLAAARRRFAELSTSLALLDASLGETAMAISASRLRAHAMARQPMDDPPLLAALEGSPALRRVYRRFLAASASHRLGDVMAASTEQIPPRRGVGCRISVERSLAESGQFIVIVELDGDAGAPPPDTLLLCGEDDRCHRFALPKPHRGVMQFIVTQDDPILSLLRDPATEALLR